MKFVFNRIKNRQISWLIIFFVLIGVFGFTNVGKVAGWGILNPIINPVDTLVASLVGGIAQIVVWVCGSFITAAIWAIIYFGQYNNFINETTITNAWAIVRDFSNMFFILGLLFIAFATILRMENYGMKRLLPKLLIMAVLINFSKTICGLIIDVSQVIMLTFMNAIGNTGGNFVTSLGVQNFLDAKYQKFWSGTDGLNLTSTLTGMITGIIFLIIACVVMLAMLAVIVMRIVMLWIYIVLSPLAFMLSAFPGGNRYASQWWGDFIKQVIVGPVLAFFLWLALITSSSSNVQNFKNNMNSTAGGAVNTDSQCFGESKILCPDDFMNFIIAIGMLMGGLMVSQQLGGIGAAWGQRTIRNMGAGAQKTVAGGAKAVLNWGGRKLDVAQMKLQKTVAHDMLGVKTYTPKTFNPRLIKKGWEAHRDEVMRTYDSKTQGTNAWHDSFNKYLRLDQYKGWKKTDKQSAEDASQADKLAYRNQKMQDREKNIEVLKSASMPERLTLMRNLNSRKEEVIREYMDKGNFSRAEAEEQFKQDRHSLNKFTDPTAEVVKMQKKHEPIIDDNRKQITSLRDDVRYKFVGKGGSKYDPKYTKAGEQDTIDKRAREIELRSDDSYAVIGELVQAVKQNDETSVVAALTVLAKNNDINEALRDKRVADLMVKENGILERIYKQKKLSGDVKQIKNNYSQNPVTPAHAQALVQGLLGYVGLDEPMAAKYANNIGNKGFAAGNGLVYGMSYGDASKGHYVFTNLMTDTKGQLQTDQDRKDAIAAKFANLESQEKMRKMHRNNFLIEDMDGNSVGLHEDGKTFLKSLTGHDLGQISRIKTDLLNKAGRSEKVMSDIKKLVLELEASSKETDKQQARIVKSFVAYIQKKVEGSERAKDVGDPDEAFKKIKVLDY